MIKKLANGKPVHLNGWKKQSVDVRDSNFQVKIPTGLVKVPASYDLRSHCSPIEDQGELGSCTANMFAALVEFNELKRVNQVQHAVMASPLLKAKPVVNTLERASRLFEYYGTRSIEGTVHEDAGATIRDAIKCGAKYGVADEKVWPYVTSKFAVNPPTAVWTAAASHKVTSYHSIVDGDIATMKASLAAGMPVGFGFKVYTFFMSSEMATGANVLHPPTSGEQLEGGHAVCLVGYDDTKSAFIVRNSWGTSWGMHGYFYMSYDYVKNTKLCSDFWVVQSAPI